MNGRTGRAARVGHARTLAAVWALCTTCAAHAQVMIQPVVAEFSPRQRILAVSVVMSERAKAPMRLQAQALRWRQDTAGQAVTEPADEIVVSPALADVKPGQRQIFRIALRKPQAQRQEQAYRLVLEDIAQPPQASETPQTGLQFRMRYDLPVMVPPEGKPVQSLRWKPCPGESAVSAPGATGPATDAHAMLCVRVANTGNRRVKLQRLQLAGDGWQHEMQLPEGALVLAGAEREWRVPLAPARGGPLRSVQARTSRGETLQAESGGF